MHYFGHESLYNCLVIELLGNSLEELFNSCSRKFSIKTVAMLAKQMVTIVVLFTGRLIESKLFMKRI